MFTISEGLKRKRHIVAVGILLGLTAGLGTVAVASDDNDNSRFIRADDHPVDYVAESGGNRSAASEQAGPGLSADDAIGRVLKRMAGSGVNGIQIVKAPEGNSALDPSLPWLRVTVESDAAGEGADVQVTWLASLAVGAVAEEMRTDQKALNFVVGGWQVVQQDSQGNVTDLDGGIGYAAAGQDFLTQREAQDPAAIRESVETAVSGFGLKVNNVQVYAPLGQAVAVTATVPSEAKIDWTVHQVLAAIGGSPLRYEGICIELVDEAGKPLLRSGTAYRTGLGGVWFAEGQDDVFGVNHG